VIWLLIAGFMLAGPVHRQALDGTNEFFRGWQMYRHFGVEICAVEYTQVLPDGSRRPIDRLATLGHADGRDAPRKLRSLKNEAAARRQGALLCRTLGAKEVRMKARCGQRNLGWVSSEADGHNLCRGQPK
jgi:hypothetical protein